MSEQDEAQLFAGRYRVVVRIRVPPGGLGRGQSRHFVEVQAVTEVVLFAVDAGRRVLVSEAEDGVPAEARRSAYLWRYPVKRRTHHSKSLSPLFISDARR